MNNAFLVGFQVTSILVGLIALVLPAVIVVLLVMIYKKVKSIEELLKGGK